MAEFENLKRGEHPPYIDCIDELEKVSIVRLKGLITRDMIPVIDARIKDNRSRGSKIEKNVIIDWLKVEDVDSATVAFNIINLKEYQAKGFEIVFININAELKGLLEIFKDQEQIKVFASEAEAIKELNK